MSNHRSCLWVVKESAPRASCVLLICSCIFFPLSTHRAYAQFDPEAAFRELRDMHSTDEAQIALLRDYILNPSEEKSVAALRCVRDVYIHILSNRVGLENFPCFRQLLQERFYPGMNRQDLGLEDRLTRALVALRRVLEVQPPSETSMAPLDEALSDFQAAYAACRAIKLDPKSTTGAELVKRWNIDPNDPRPESSYLREFIELTVGIAREHQDIGPHLGAILAAVMRDAKVTEKDDIVADVLDPDCRILIDLDGGNLAGTSYFYLFQQKLAAALPEPEWAQPNEIRSLLKSSPGLEQHLETGAKRMQYPSNAYKPFEQYSDVLHKLAEGLRSSWPTESKLREDLVRASCRILRKGIESSLDHAAAAGLINAQEKLVDRVRSYGEELGSAERYPEMIEFEGAFLDRSGRILTQPQQCYIHAHLAQASYLIKEYGKAMEHMDDLQKYCPALVSQDYWKNLWKNLSERAK